MAVLTDPISDFLTRWKNASRARKEDFSAPFSRVKAEIARILSNGETVASTTTCRLSMIESG